MFFSKFRYKTSTAVQSNSKRTKYAFLISIFKIPQVIIFFKCLNYLSRVAQINQKLLIDFKISFPSADFFS